MEIGNAARWRDRLANLVFSSSHPSVIAAPPGFGVGTIAAHIQSSSLPATATVLDLEQRDVGELGIEKLLSKHVVFTGREVPDLRRIPGAQLIDHSVLRFTEAEALEEALLHGVDEALAQAIYTFTRGWPAYFNACIRVAAVAPQPTPTEAFDRLHQGSHLQPLIDACTQELSLPDKTRVAQLTHFTKVSAGVVEALLGAKGLSMVQRSGVPIVETHPGWYEILEPVRSALRATATLDEQTARTLAPELVADAGLVAGARILLSAGQPAAAASALRSVPVHKLDEGSQGTLLSLLRTVLDTEKDDGSLHLRLARVHHNHGDLPAMRKTLVRAARAAEEQLRPDLQTEAEAELLLLDLPDLDAESVRERHLSLSDRAHEHSNSLAQIRLREVEVILGFESGDLAQIYQGVSKMESVANDWELIGEPARAAATLRFLSTGAVGHLGRYRQATILLERARELSENQPQAQVKSLVLLGRQAAMIGDLNRFAEIDERATDLIANARLAWLDAYHKWSAMIAAGFRREVDEVASLQKRSEALLGALFTHSSGLVFLSEATLAFVFAGAIDRAVDMLERARPRAAESPIDFGIAEIYVAARQGDPQTRLLAEQLRSSVEVPIERDWRIDLALALAGDPAGLEAELDRIELEAERHDLQQLFATSVHAWGVEPKSPAVRLQLLGSFQIETAAGPQQISGGKAEELVKFLGVRVKPCPVDIVIEHLWGDIPVDVGLRRMKNVVSRARTALGQDAVERRGQTIGLSKEVTSDLVDVRAMLKSLQVDPYQIDKAVQAVDSYHGPLLELDLYDDWVDEERRSLNASMMSALEIVVDAAAKPAAWVFDALRRLRPEDERPFMAAADLASRQGDETTLQLCLDEVRRICQDLDVELPTSIDRLAARISS